MIFELAVGDIDHLGHEYVHIELFMAYVTHKNEIGDAYTRGVGETGVDMRKYCKKNRTLPKEEYEKINEYSLLHSILDPNISDVFIGCTDYVALFCWLCKIGGITLYPVVVDGLIDIGGYATLPEYPETRKLFKELED